MKDIQLDLGAERKMQAVMEKELTEAKKTVGKLQTKTDDMMCDVVKSGKYVAMMVQKSQLKHQDK